MSLNSPPQLPRPSRGWSPRVALAVLGLLFCLLAGAWSALIPLGEAPDEVSHHSYVRYVAEYGGLPPAIEGTTVFGETFQPPLYYILAAPLTAWLPRGPESNLGFAIPVENNPDWELGNPARARVLLQPAAARWPWRGEALGWHLARGLSILFGLVTLVATYKLARLVFPGEPWTAFLAAAFVAFLPTFTALSATVTNDVLATMLSALLLWQLARLVVGTRGRTDWRGWAFAGLLGCLGVWTKASGWVFVPIVILAVVLAARRPTTAGALWAGRPPTENGRWKAVDGGRWAFSRLLAAGGAWLVVALPLFWMNWQRSGDLLGRGLQARVTEQRESFSLQEALQLLPGLYRSWWAGFGGAVHLNLPDWLNLVLGVLLLVAVGGLLRRHLRRASASAATRRLLPILAAHAVLVFIAWFIWTGLVMGADQGRLLYPALPATAVLLAGGWVAVTPPREWRAPRPALLWSAAILALPLATLLFILLPAYRAAPALAEPPSGAASESLQIGSLPLALTSFYFPLTVDDHVPPGTGSRFYVAWRADGPLPDVRLRLRWIDADGNSRWVKEGSPIADHPLTDEWQPGNYSAWHRVPVPEGVEPGWYRL
ncbi:MAG TPA: glycosyltransferase family 39 protein, partial [Ardenticatenaceae bacterium]